MNEKQDFKFPIFLNLTNKKVLVVGGGSVALRKINQLVDAGAKTTVIAINIYDAIYNMPNVTCIKKAIEDSDFKPYFTLVILATDDIEVQERSAFVCRKAGILVNRCDLPEDGDFITASVLYKPPVSAAVTASRVPAMARLVRKRFENTLEPALLELAVLLEEMRPHIKAAFNYDSKSTAEFFARWASEEMVDKVRAIGIEKVREELKKCLSC